MPFRGSKTAPVPISVVVFLFAMLLGFGEVKAMSEEMSQLVKRLKTDEVSLNVSGLAKSHEAKFAARTAKSKMEEYKVRNGRYADTFGYVIYVDHTRREYWVRRTGGVAGVSEICGPGELP